MKLFNFSLFILSLAIGTSTPVLAADPPQEADPYQSTFEGYKTLSDDNLSDWKSTNVPSIGDVHAEHSMANKSSGSKNMSDTAGMVHSQKKHDKPKADQKMPLEKLDHKKMPDIEGTKHSHPLHGNAETIVHPHEKNTSQPEVASGHHHDDVKGEPHEH